ncbi:efflux RND transporter periplasmic adaptor subunit [Bacillus sp. JJ1764]|uniref:efflux RND transporter periplasmic adaptor subunit n=1 Tax=Bacillus sp. JJ1764 TaxID=3122964 RepID=UPI002FFFD9B6
MKKWIWIVISVVIVGYVGYMWYHSKSSSSEAATTQISSATVQKGKLEVKISGSGTIEPVTSEDIKVKDANDEIDEVLVSAGSKVSAGDELVTFTDDSDPITAPVDGTITSVSVSTGERVTKGQAVAHLTNYTDLQTVVAVDELDIAKVKVNQTVSLTVTPYPDATYTGMVTAVANEGTSESGSSTFDVTIHLVKSDNLKVGMSTEAEILAESKDNALYVPVDAVHTKNETKYVNVMKSSSNSAGSSKTEQRTIKTGISNDDYIEITEGVTEGDYIKLPKRTASTSTSNQGGMMPGFDGMDGGTRPPSGNGNSSSNNSSAKSGN